MEVREFLDKYAEERDIVVIMSAYKKEFGKRLTTAAYRNLIWAIDLDEIDDSERSMKDKEAA